MNSTNKDLVDKFFAAYSKHDIDGIKEVMVDDAQWFFLGRHPLAGVKNGVEEIVEFFDKMGAIMSKSKPQVDKLLEVNDGKYFIECQHIQTNRPDGINISHHATVLWTIEGGKIVSGRHFFADPEAVDRYFTDAVASGLANAAK